MLGLKSKMESRSLSLIWTFNRTMLGLKYRKGHYFAENDMTFNRTMLGLKSFKQETDLEKV